MYIIGTWRAEMPVSFQRHESKVTSGNIPYQFLENTDPYRIRMNIFYEPHTLLKIFKRTGVFFHPTLNEGWLDNFCWNFGLNNDLVECSTQLLQNIRKEY